jgi:hypothetical protein
MVWPVKTHPAHSTGLESKKNSSDGEGFSLDRSFYRTDISTRLLETSGLPVIVRHERERPRGRVVRNCLTDEGGPLGTGLQERVPNHLRRLLPKAMVVSAEGKGLALTGSGIRQEEDRKGTTVEVSKAMRRCQNRGVITTAGQSSDETCLRAERHPA